MTNPIMIIVVSLSVVILLTLDILSEASYPVFVCYETQGPFLAISFPYALILAALTNAAGGWLQNSDSFYNEKSNGKQSNGVHAR